MPGQRGKGRGKGRGRGGVPGTPYRPGGDDSDEEIEDEEIEHHSDKSASVAMELFPAEDSGTQPSGSHLPKPPEPAGPPPEAMDVSHAEGEGSGLGPQLPAEELPAHVKALVDSVCLAAEKSTRKKKIKQPRRNPQRRKNM